MHTGNGGFSIGDEARPHVAQPTIVMRERELINPLAGQQRYLGNVLRLDDDGDGLELRDSTGQFGNRVARTIEMLAPGLGPAWPSHPATRMRGPLSWHEKAIIERTWLSCHAIHRLVLARPPHGGEREECSKSGKIRQSAIIPIETA